MEYLSEFFRLYVAGENMTVQYSRVHVRRRCQQEKINQGILREYLSE